VSATTHLLQETMLFTGAVAENIAYGTHARREDVVWGARLAAADGFIAGHWSERIERVLDGAERALAGEV
jgi:ABC-type multidrug transport system fused ATPase/permease subunit